MQCASPWIWFCCLGWMPLSVDVPPWLCTAPWSDWGWHLGEYRVKMLSSLSSVIACTSATVTLLLLDRGYCASFCDFRRASLEQDCLCNVLVPWEKPWGLSIRSMVWHCVDKFWATKWKPVLARIVLLQHPQINPPCKTPLTKNDVVLYFLTDLYPFCLSSFVIPSLQENLPKAFRRVGRTGSWLTMVRTLKSYITSCRPVVVV